MTSSNEFLEQDVPEWKDDKRMSVYMQNFKQFRQVNQADWDNRIRFWSDIILKTCLATNRILVSVADLKLIMTRFRKSINKTEVPLGWATIIDQLIQKQILVEEKEFQARCDHYNAPSSISMLWNNLVVVPSKFFYSWISKSTTNPYITDGESKTFKSNLNKQFVVVPVVREMLNHYFKKQLEGSTHDVDLIVSPSQLRYFFQAEYPRLKQSVYQNYQNFKSNIMSEKEIQLVLEYAFSNALAKPVYLFDTSKSHQLNYQRIGILILSSSLQQNDSQTMIQNIVNDNASVWKGVLYLKESRYKLERQKEKYEEQITQCVDKAKNYLKQKLKEQSTLMLKKKLMLQKSLYQKEQQLQNIEKLLNSIHDAHSDLEVLEALKHGSSSLTKLNEEMQSQNVEQIMEQVEQSLADQKEIQQIMDGLDLKSVDNIDEEEIMEDVNQLEMELGFSQMSVTKKPEQKPQQEPVTTKSPVTSPARKAEASGLMSNSSTKASPASKKSKQQAEEDQATEKEEKKMVLG